MMAHVGRRHDGAERGTDVPAAEVAMAAARPLPERTRKGWAEAGRGGWLRLVPGVPRRALLSSTAPRLERVVREDVEAAAADRLAEVGGRDRSVPAPPEARRA